MVSKAERRRLNRLNAQRRREGLAPITRSQPKAETSAEPPRAQHDSGKDGPQPGPYKSFEQYGKGATAKYRNVENVHQLDLAYERGMLGDIGPHSNGRADALYRAGKVYRGLCEAIHRSGLDSTQMIDRTRSGDPSPPPGTQAQADAAMMLGQIDKKLAPRNKEILRNFCGENRSMTESVYRVTGCHPNGVKYRLVEALEDLEDALRGLHVRKAA